VLAKVFLPHILATVIYRSYAPGVFTAVLVNLPLMNLLVFLALREDWVSGKKAVTSAIAVGANPMPDEVPARMTNDPGKKPAAEQSRNQDQGKGAVEQDQNNEGGNISMQGQLGHRDENVDLKNSDSDLPG